MIRNIYLSTVTTGSQFNSKLLNIGIYDDLEELNFYCEVDNNIAEILAGTNQFAKDVISKQFFNTVDQYKVQDGKTKTLYVKDTRHGVLSTMQEYLLKLTNNGMYKLQFWIDDPLDWTFFLNTFFMFKDEIPIVPEYINPYPSDLHSIINFAKKDNEMKIENLLDIPEDFLYNSLTKSMYNRQLHKTLQGLLK